MSHLIFVYKQHCCNTVPKMLPCSYNTYCEIISRTVAKMKKFLRIFIKRSSARTEVPH